MTVTREAFTDAMRQFPAAVNLVTTGSGAARAGLTATSVMSLTADPPQVGVAINKAAASHQSIHENAAFCINTLAAHHADLAGRFAGAVKGAERFATGTWTTLVTGSPALEDALLCLDCRIVQEVDIGTHTLFVGRVEAIAKQPAFRALLYVDGDWAGLMGGISADVDLFQSGLQQSIDAIDTAVDKAPNPPEQLMEFVRNFAKVHIAEPQMAQKYLGAHLYVSPASLADLNRKSRVFDDKLTRLLEAGNQQGQFEIINPRIAAFAISGLVAWVHRWYRPGGQLSPEEIADQLAMIVQRMVEPRESAPGQADRTTPNSK